MTEADELAHLRTVVAAYDAAVQALVRLERTIVNVRTERLQDITDEDALAEGAVDYLSYLSLTTNLETVREFSRRASVRNIPYPCAYFANLWDSIHGKKPEHSWDANPAATQPWCWVRGVEVAKTTGGGE